MYNTLGDNMILILNGSPNKEVKQYDLYNYKIESCDDCKYCDHKTACSKKDDMTRIYDDLYNTETLIIASPIYFGSLSDITMKVINRFQRYYSQKYVLNDLDIPKFKNIILVSTQASDKLYMFDGPKATMNILGKLFSPLNTQSILVPSSDDINYINKDVLNLINEAKEKMN